MGKILLSSSVFQTEQNKWLNDLLSNKKEPILKYDEIAKLEKDKSSFLQSSLFTNLYNEATNEWEIDHIQEDEEKMDCTLCGKKDTKKKYFIKNKINGIMFNVGSDCVHNFGEIRGANGKTLVAFEKEWKIQNRDKLLNNEYPRNY